MWFSDGLARLWHRSRTDATSTLPGISSSWSWWLWWWCWPWWSLLFIIIIHHGTNNDHNDDQPSLLVALVGPLSSSWAWSQCWFIMIIMIQIIMIIMRQIIAVIMIKNHRGQPSLLVAGVGRGREESSMLTAIKEAARRWLAHCSAIFLCYLGCEI